MSPLHFATYFDRHYLLRGLALYRSLRRHSPPFVLRVLCLDGETHEILTRLALPAVELVPLAELERADPELLRVRGTRSRLEYYWTCGPAYLLYLFERRPEIELLTYLDADLFLFGDPAPAYQELGAGSILLIGNRPTRDRLAINRAKGTYNVGLLAFRRGSPVSACLRRWREQCLEWCYYRIEPDRYGDQKYLDDWPERYDGVVVLSHKGVGLATWSLGNHHYRYEEGRVMVDGDPLLVYHFGNFRTLTPWLYDPCGYRYLQRIGPVVRRHIYVPYARELRAARRMVGDVGGRVPARDKLNDENSRPRMLRRMLRHRSFLIVTDSFAL